MARLAAAVLTIVAGLALAAPLALGGDEEDDAPLKPRPAVTAEQLEERLDRTKVTVDWKDTAVLDGLNEVRQKAGIKFIFDQTLADFAAGRKVTFDGYAVTAREALRILQRACGFAIEADPIEGGFKLSLDPSAPTRAALDEKKLSVEWKDWPVQKCEQDIERKTGFKIEIHPALKPRLKDRKITWQAADVRAREAIECLYVYPPPSVPGRIDPKKDMKVVLVYAGKPESKADVDFALEEKRATFHLEKAKVTDFAKAVSEAGGFRCDADPKLVERALEVTYKAQDVALRDALDAVARMVGLTWKVEGAKVVLRAPPEKK